MTILNNLFCSLLLNSRLQKFLLPCPFKYLTGIDCPGCGFQRSVIALLQGNFAESFSLYPATIPLILFFAFGLADYYFKLDTPKHTITKTTYILIGSVILISYGVKLARIYILSV